MKSISYYMMAALLLLSLDVSAQKNADATLSQLFDAYFNIEDALVASQPKQAAEQAVAFSAALNKVDMAKLSSDEHEAFMGVLPELKKNASAISSKSDLSKQRDGFRELSAAMYTLAKATKQDNPLYYNNCPMAKANWLSRAKEIKNPYYGSQMLGCGKTIETINK